MNPLAGPVLDVAHIIDLAVAPVFLIAGVGALLNVMTSRLGRVVDRGRALEDEIAGEPDGEPRERHLRELRMLDGRMKRINLAISLATLAALLVCLVIVTLFTGELVTVDLSRLVAVLFILTMGVLIASLVLFLGEIAIATRTLRVRAEVLERKG